MKLVFDVEANGLLYEATKMWCLVSKDIETKKEYALAEESYTNTARFVIPWLNEAETLIGHGILSYDFPLLKKLYGWEPHKDQEIIDTLVWSRLLNPDRPSPPGYKGKARHSVEAWAIRLGHAPKIQNEVWDRWTTVILDRCRSDVSIQEQIYYALLKEKNG